MPPSKTTSVAVHPPGQSCAPERTASAACVAAAASGDVQHLHGDGVAGVRGDGRAFAVLALPTAEQHPVAVGLDGGDPGIAGREQLLVGAFGELRVVRVRRRQHRQRRRGRVVVRVTGAQHRRVLGGGQRGDRRRLRRSALPARARCSRHHAAARHGSGALSNAAGRAGRTSGRRP